MSFINIFIPAWKGLSADMDACSSGVSDLLDLASLLANDGTTLRGGHQEVQCQIFISAVTGPISTISLFLFP